MANDLFNSFMNGPDEKGRFGKFGGRFVSETLMPLILELEKQYEKAKSELLIAELNVERCQIKAPFDGAVEEVVVNTFETIQPQVELMKIIQTEVLELEMVVSSEWISWLKIGHPIKVYIDEIQKEFNATISGIGANVDAVSQTIQLKGTITDTSPALLPGMSGRVVF